nr:AI-2E family transporter [Chryseolinea lacunae]
MIFVTFKHDFNQEFHSTGSLGCAMQTENPARSKSTPLYYIQLVVYAGVILYVGRDLFIPVSFALLISFILYPVCQWLETKGFGRATAIAISLSLLLVFGILLMVLLASQFISFLNEWPSLQAKFQQALADVRYLLDEGLGIGPEQQKNIIGKLSAQSGSNLFRVIQSTVTASAFSLLLLVLIPVYAVLILYYRRYWMDVLARIFPAQQREHLVKIISLSIGTYYNFVKGMVIVYLIVGTLNSIGLLLLGIPHAILFGFIAAILTIVPYVGIVAGSLLPMAMAWITFDSIWYPLGVVGIFTLVQYLEANIIFPIAVSSRLNVNTLVMLLVIFAGGMLWGMAGMILFVPFAGIAKLIADQNPAWKTISMILGTNTPPNK